MAYPINNQLRLTATFKDIDNAPVDPTDVNIYTEDPAGTTTTYTTGTLTNSTVGTYYKDILFSTAGDWSFWADGSGAAVGQSRRVYFTIVEV